MSFAGQPGPRRGSTPTFLGFVLFILSASVSLAAETRIALVIGNGTYREAPLKNPPEDARLIADTLKGLGFTLIGAKPLIDADQKAMKRAIRSFGEQLERAGSDGVGLFFYAGHAVQANGKNYLIPVGADIRGEADLEDDTVSADSVMRQMTAAGAPVNLVVLDACRNNPYRGQFRSPTRGLAEMSAPRGSLVAYSTAPGDVAEDGTGKNSPYSAALAEAMGIADKPVELVFKRVRSVVMQATGNRQVPWESSSLIGDFYFAQTALVPPAAPVPLPAHPEVRPAVGIYPPAYKAFEGFKECGVCPQMVALPGGTFTMGSPATEPERAENEGPQRRVTIRPFAIGKTEVTFAEWDACVTAGGCNRYKPPDEGWGRGSRPVINVSWNDAKAYVSWLSQHTGKPYRLPSEAEWEYAARAGTTTRYAFGDVITPKDANYGLNVGKTTEVGAYPPNAWGLHDMHSNVCEWVEDIYHDNYKGAPSDGAAWTDGEGANRGERSRRASYRGGAWSGNPGSLRSAVRDGYVPDLRSDYLGFRVARTLD